MAETAIAAQITATEAITSVVRAMLRFMRVLLNCSFEAQDRIAPTPLSNEMAFPDDDELKYLV
jgi:hypothetical protein